MCVNSLDSRSGSVSVRSNGLRWTTHVQTVIYWEWVLDERCDAVKEKRKQLKIEVKYLNRRNIIWCIPWFIEYRLQCVCVKVFLWWKERILSKKTVHQRRIFQMIVWRRTFPVEFHINCANGQNHCKFICFTSTINHNQIKTKQMQSDNFDSVVVFFSLCLDQFKIELHFDVSWWNCYFNGVCNGHSNSLKKNIGRIELQAKWWRHKAQTMILFALYIIDCVLFLFIHFSMRS